MRRTKLQRQMHRRLVEEGLVAGHPGGQIVRMLAAKFGLTLRQARLDLQQVQAEFRRQDDELRQNRWKLADLAVASDRCDRECRAAVEAGDARRAMRVEKHRCKLLGIYHADRRRTPHMPLAKRMAIAAKFKTDLDAMYAEAPRNADGSVVLTAYSLTPPPVDDRRYRRSIEQPLARGPSPKRQERIDTMRAMLAAGGRMDQLEAAARGTYRLSSRQVRADVRQLQDELEDDGYAMHQGTHDAQLLPLALRRRQRIAEMALRPAANAPRESEESVADSLRESECQAAGGESERPSDGNSQRELPTQTGGKREAPAAAVEILRSAQNDKPKAAAQHDQPKARARNDKPKAKPPDVRLAAVVEIDRCRLLGLYCRERPRPEEDQLLWKPPQWKLDDDDEPVAGGEEPVAWDKAASAAAGPPDANDANDPPASGGPALAARAGPTLRAAQDDAEPRLPPASPWDEPGPYANLHHGEAGGEIDNPSCEGLQHGDSPGRIDNPSYKHDRPDSLLDRMVEEDFAIRDARRGIRHTVAELLPGHAGREPWKPPKDC